MGLLKKPLHLLHLENKWERRETNVDRIFFSNRTNKPLWHAKFLRRWDNLLCLYMEKQKKFYIVTQGDLNDRKVVGIFKNKKEAKGGILILMI